MGNQIGAPAPVETGPHVVEQQRLFAEYKQLCLNNVQKAEDDAKRWDSVKDTILDLPIEEQSEYADYVTCGICGMNDEIVESSGASLMPMMNLTIENRHKMRVTAVANCAKTILAQKGDLKDHLMEKYREMVEVQRNIKNNPNLREQFNDMPSTDNVDDFGKAMGAMVSTMMKNVNKELENNENPENIGRTILTQIAGEEAADDILQQMQAGTFLQGKVNEGMKLDDAIRATRDEFDLPGNTELEVKIKITLDQVPYDEDVQSIDDQTDDAED